MTAQKPKYNKLNLIAKQHIKQILIKVRNGGLITPALEKINDIFYNEVNSTLLKIENKKENENKNS